MNRLVIAARLIAWRHSCGAQSVDQFKLIGQFDNVSSADGGEHCSGYALNLWESNARLLGFLHLHSGLCGDPPCAAIHDPSFDPKTGSLVFSARIASESVKFVGSLQGKRIRGTLNGRPVRLNRLPLRTETFEPDRSLQAWCSFWESVPRCAGVKDLCQSLR